MLTKGMKINDMQVFLDVERSKETVTVKILICKTLQAPPIFSDMVSVILEAADGSFLKPIGLPDPGVLPEARMRGTTASTQFTFDVDTRLKLHRAIVFLCGDWAEFKLNDI
jgi:hypothetical protein